MCYFGAYIEKKRNEQLVINTPQLTDCLYAFIYILSCNVMYKLKCIIYEHEQLNPINQDTERGLMRARGKQNPIYAYLL